jgi:hypothetical protein
MAAQVSVRSASRWWGVIVSALVIFLAQGSLFAQRSSARYVGGTLDAPPNVIRYRCKAPKVTLDLTSDSNLLVGGHQKKALTLRLNLVTEVRARDGQGRALLPVGFVRTVHEEQTLPSDNVLP